MQKGKTDLPVARVGAVCITHAKKSEHTLKVKVLWQQQKAQHVCERPNATETTWIIQNEESKQTNNHGWCRGSC
jgi:hypothetical protein